MNALIKNDGKSNSKFQSNLNSLLSKTVKEDLKMEGDLDFFLSDNVNQENILNEKRKSYGIQNLNPYHTSRIKSQKNFNKYFV